MADESPLPTLLVTSNKSQFRLRVISAAWSDSCGPCGTYKPGLVLLSAVGPVTAVQAIRATMHCPDIECDIRIEATDSDGDETLHELTRARYDDKPCGYEIRMSKLATGATHIVALAKLPGLLPNISDAHLWQELSSVRYTTPMLPAWTGWLKRKMIEDQTIVICEGIESSAGILNIDPAQLDELVSAGVRRGWLKIRKEEAA